MRLEEAASLDVLNRALTAQRAAEVAQITRWAKRVLTGGLVGLGLMLLLKYGASIMTAFGVALLIWFYASMRMRNDADNNRL